MSQLELTSLEDLKEYANGSLVELPPFANNQKFVARLRRPSMLALVKNGKIPNQLLSTANELFAGNNNSIVDADDNSAMSKLFEVIDVLCDSCFISPSYKEIKEAGVELTDEQLMFVFNYTQHGVRALKTFRSE